MRLSKTVALRALALFFLQAFAGDALADEAVDWMKSGNAAKYLRVADDVYSIETLQPVAKGLFKGLRGARAIKDSPGVFYVPASTEASLVPGVAISGWLQRPGAPASVNPLDKLPQQDRTGQNAYLASDLRRVAYVDKGDWWRGDVDWATGDVINRKQVTSVGQFTPYEQPVLGWFGNYLFVLGKFDEKKPVVRIDLISGDVLEIPHSEVFNVRGTMHMGNVNPAGDRLIAAEIGQGKVIFAFDPYSAKEWTLPNLYKPSGGMNRVAMTAGSPVSWLDNDTAVAAADRALVKIDLAAGKTTVIERPRSSKRGTAVFLPGGQFVLIDVYPKNFNAHTHSNEDIKTQVLDLRTGEATEVPSEFGVWLDDRRFLYSKTTGGLTQLGTYLFDRTTGKSVRLSNVTMSGEAAYIPERDEICFTSNQPSPRTVFVRSDGSNARSLDQADVQLIGEPIDLGWGKPAAELWDPARYKPRPTNIVTAGDALAEVVGDKAQISDAKPGVHSGQPGATSQPVGAKPQQSQEQEKETDVVSDVKEKANKAKDAAKGIGDLFKKRFP